MAVSLLADRFEPSRRKLPARKHAVQALVIHTTGGGIVRKALRNGEEALDYAVAYYTRPRAYTAHYLIGWNGEIVALVDEDTVAYHAGMIRTQARIYRRGPAEWRRYTWRRGKPVEHEAPQPRYDDWLDRWPGLDNPTQIVGSNVNRVTIGIDLLAPVPGSAYGDTQVGVCACLVREILNRHRLPVKHDTVLRHSDLTPLSRSTSRGGWDPPMEPFRRLCAHLGIHE